ETGGDQRARGQREFRIPDARTAGSREPRAVGAGRHAFPRDVHRPGHLRVHLRGSRSARHEGNRHRPVTRRCGMRVRLFAIVLVLAACAAAQPAGGDAYRGGLVTPPLAKPRFVLTDTSGAPFDFWTRTLGSVTLLFFGYTNCPDQCPMHMANIGQALKRLPPEVADHVQLVFVTTDPARDTPAVLRRGRDSFGKRFVGAAGTHPA